MAGSVSLRRSIRWLPDPASEPTSTVVLTSPGRRFVDVRVLLPGEGEDEATAWDDISLDRLDWALAGTATHTPLPLCSTAPGSRSGPSSHAVFTHWIDSRSAATDGIRDEGDMHPQPDGSTLETGEMENPATGRVTPYEEVWLDEDVGAAHHPSSPAPAPAPAPGPASESAVAVAGGRPSAYVVAITDSPQHRGMAVRVGRYCQGLLRAGDKVWVERWELSPPPPSSAASVSASAAATANAAANGDTAAAGRPQWRRAVKMGERKGDALPCFELTDMFGPGGGGDGGEDHGAEVGDAMVLDGRTWEVVEAGRA